MNIRGGDVDYGRRRMSYSEVRAPKFSSERSPSKWMAPAPKHDEVLDKLTSEIDALKKKLAFLQKIDVSVLGDENGQGDVTFVVENEEVIKAHRIILVSKSSIFKKMFDTNMIEKYTGKIHIQDISHPVLRAMVKFLYTAEVQFTMEVTAVELFKVAHRYDIPELQAECEAELYNSVTEDNLSQMLRISHLYGMQRLMEKSVKLFKDNFDRIQSRVFCELIL